MTSEQNNIYSVMKQFARICEAHDLKYFLAGGSLIGAVRHKGFIPWDDDMDIMMPAEDYKRFLALGSELPEGLELQTEDDPCYPFLFAKLCDTGIPFETGAEHGPKGVYIDLFPIYPSRKPDGWAKLGFNIISVIGYVLQVKLGWLRYDPYKKAYARLAFNLLHLCPGGLLKKIRHLVSRSIAKNDTEYCFSPGGGHKGLVEFYPKRWFEGQAVLAFEDEMFPVPTGWHEYLEQLYGEYMILPDLEERKTMHKETLR